jgi:rod shape determining protein RodA
MRNQRTIIQNIDWVTIILFVLLVTFGWINIYAAVYDDEHSSIFDISQSYGKQMIWIITSFVLVIMILIIDAKFYEAFAFPIYGSIILLLLFVLIFGREVAGSRSWFEIGSVRVQPSEFAKFATCLALAKFLSLSDIKISELKTKMISAFIIGLPMALILLQNDTGSALVFFAFIFVLYREGLSQNVLLFGFFIILLFVFTLLFSKLIMLFVVTGIGVVAFLLLQKTRKNSITIGVIFAIVVSFIFTVDYAFNKILEPHQRQRIEVLLGKKTDLRGAGYNVNQSLIAIGSGGFSGKGFLNGTQTKFNFVPEQSTDFIFCTVGEEWGFVGTLVVLMLFLLLLWRLIYIAERQKSKFTRIYGYGVASLLFFHLMVNIGMTIGLMPVIGIPLPFFSYGGSSLWSFTILLFIFVKLDSIRATILK